MGRAIAANRVFPGWPHSALAAGQRMRGQPGSSIQRGALCCYAHGTRFWTHGEFRTDRPRVDAQRAALPATLGADR